MEFFVEEIYRDSSKPILIFEDVLTSFPAPSVVSLSAEFALAVLLVTDGELLLLLLFDVGLSVPGDTVSALSNSMFEDSGALVETSIVLERLAIDSTFFAVG